MHSNWVSQSTSKWSLSFVLMPHNERDRGLSPVSRTMEFGGGRSLFLHYNTGAAVGVGVGLYADLCPLLHGQPIIKYIRSSIYHLMTADVESPGALQWVHAYRRQSFVFFSARESSSVVRLLALVRHSVREGGSSARAH